MKYNLGGCRVLNQISNTPYDPKNEQLYRRGARVLDKWNTGDGVVSRYYYSSKSTFVVSFLHHLLQKNDDDKVKALFSFTPQDKHAPLLERLLERGHTIRRLCHFSPHLPPAAFTKATDEDLLYALNNTPFDEVKRNAIAFLLKNNKLSMPLEVKPDEVAAELEKARAFLKSMGLNEAQITIGLEEYVKDAVTGSTMTVHGKYTPGLIDRLLTEDGKTLVRQLSRQETIPRTFA